MSYQDSSWIDLEFPFSGGYVDNTPAFTLNDNYSPFLRNARFEGQAIKIRPWHSLLATLTAWSFPKWIGSYLRANPANDVLLVRHNKDADEKLATITEAWTVTDINTWSDITSDNRMTFQNVWDVIYCMNWSDDFGKLDWTTYTTPTTGISNFAPSFSEVFNSSHWASGWSDNPNVVYKSVADDYEDFASAWSDSFTFQESVTWLETNNKDLFIFTKNTVSVIWSWDIQETGWVITYFTRALWVREWSTNNSTIISAWTNVYYITPSNRIVRVYKWADIDWFETLELSERKYAGISNIMASLDLDQSDAFGYYLPKENIIKWFMKREGSDINDICIIYDITKDSFLIDEQKYFFDWVNFKGRNYTVSNVEPKVYQDEVNQDDEDAWIPFEYQTKDFTFWDPSRKKILWESRTFTKINELAEFTQEIYVDWQLVDTKTIDKDNITVSWWWIWLNPVWTFAMWTWSWVESEDELQEVVILRTKWTLNIRWKKIRFRWICDTLAAKAQLEDLQIRLEQLPELTNNLTI